VYTIGEFAAFGRVSVRMLRHWDAIGLLVPERVDEHSGYRLYSPAQVHQLLRVVELRSLGIGLERVAAVVTADDEAAATRAALLDQARVIEAAMADDTARLARIRRMLHLLEGTTTMDVTYRSIEPLTVYAVSGVAPGMGPQHVGPMVGPLIGSLDAALQAAGRPLLEPSVFWYDGGPDDTLTVHISYPAEPTPVPGDGYDVVDLPAVPLAATTRHHGDMSGIGDSWNALFERLVADGYRMVGPTREVYLVADGHEPGPDWVTELQVPVLKV